MASKFCRRCGENLSHQHYQIEVLRIIDDVGIARHTGRIDLCGNCIGRVTARKAITRWGFQYK